MKPSAELKSLRKVRDAAKALSDYMHKNSGAATGELIRRLHKAIERHELHDDPAREFL